jgi:plasmid stabilization system protein ParE
VLRTIRWSRTALLQLAEIPRYVAQDKPVAAGKLALRIKNSTNFQASFPDSGRVGLTPETRQWVIPGTRYIANFSVDAEELRILSPHHGMTNWAADPDKPK